MIAELGKNLFGSLLTELLVLLIAIFVKDDKRKMAIVLLLGTTIAGMIGFGPQLVDVLQGVFRSLRRVTEPITVPPTASAVVPEQVSLGTIRVPGSAEEGVKFVAEEDGEYVFTYVEGAYSPWPGADPEQPRWRTRINVYRNRSILWRQRPYNPEDDRSIVYREPSEPDAYIGNYEVTTWEGAVGAARSSGVLRFELRRGDFLIFVAVDDQGWYNDPAPNVGEVVFEVTAVVSK